MRETWVKILSLLVALLSIPVLMGCATSSPPATPTPSGTVPASSPTVAPKPSGTVPASSPTAAPTPALPKSTRLASGPQGGRLEGYCLAFSDVLQKRLGLSVALSPTPGQAGQVELHHAKQVEFSILGATHVVLAINGAKGFESTYTQYAKLGPTPMRVLIVGDLLPISALTNKTDIRKPADLKGKKIYAINLGSPANLAQTRAILEVAGLSEKDVTLLEFPSTTQANQWLLEGRADAVVRGTGGSAAIQFETAAGVGKALYLSLPITPEAMKVYGKHLPGAMPYTAEAAEPCVPKGSTFFGVPNMVVTTADVSDNLVYAVTKTLLENNDQLVAMQKDLNIYTLNNTLANLPVAPFHPGAIKYFKERGVWTSALEQRQQELLNEEKQFSAGK